MADLDDVVSVLKDIKSAIGDLHETITLEMRELHTKINDLKECIEAEGGAITKNQDSFESLVSKGEDRILKVLRSIDLALVK